MNNPSPIITPKQEAINRLMSAMMATLNMAQNVQPGEVIFVLQACIKAVLQSQSKDRDMRIKTVLCVFKDSTEHEMLMSSTEFSKEEMDRFHAFFDPEPSGDNVVPIRQ